MGLQVLIVDDSATMRSILKKVVSLSGYEVSRYLEAANGQEALDTLAQEWVDLILLDLHMPVMDGLDLLRHINKEELHSRIPSVLVTTEGSKQAIDEAKALGIKAHVKKPFQPETIRDILQQVLGEEYARADEEDPEGCDF
jgi:two-component system chemotaxis response regulator CheY